MKHFKPLLILFLTALLAVPATSQKQDAIEAVDHIRSLKSSALLVRLKTKQKSIDALHKIGQSARAERIEAEQRTKNLEIVSAFNAWFTFCPVYFFYSHDSDLIREDNISKVKFLNDSLNYDATISVSTDTFYIAEFGNIEQQPETYKESPYLVKTDSTGVKRKELVGGQTNFGFGALLIRDRNFMQLKRPFPYYVRTLDSLPIKRKTKSVIKKMNGKLIDFYGG